MTTLLEQFILESRDLLQGIGEKLMALERTPESVELMTDLFRMVHTMKGNSGLFEFNEIIETLHAAEDIMDAVRDGRIPFERTLSDRLLDTMDFVGVLLDTVESSGAVLSAHAALSHYMAQGLRELLPAKGEDPRQEAAPPPEQLFAPPPPLDELPEETRMEAWRAARKEGRLFRLIYRPEEECFFKGEDPFHQARNTPGFLGGTVRARAPWPPLAEMDCYRCAIDFDILSSSSRTELQEYFRYVPEQVALYPVPHFALAIPRGKTAERPVHGDFVAEALQLLDSGDIGALRAAAETLLELSAPDLRISSALRWLLLVLEEPENTLFARRLLESIDAPTPPDWSDLETGFSEEELPAPPAPALPKSRTPELLESELRPWLDHILSAQADILALPDDGDWLKGRLQGCAASLRAILPCLGESPEELDEPLAESIAAASAEPLRKWLAALIGGLDPSLFEPETLACEEGEEEVEREPLAPLSPAPAETVPSPPPESPPPDGNGIGEIQFGRRAEDTPSSRVLKVEQAKVDYMMDLIGEMVVAKNALPYLADRAEKSFGVRELSREIFAQYAVINRIASEMQDAIMQIRMMPLSFIFQRFPRLVRDISRKLGKEVELVLEGEETETDKNIAEALADPLIHIVRNSLDHGLETSEARAAAGKPGKGTLSIRAVQESDRAIIEIADDGRGIDPAIIKRKAYEKGLIDEERLERITDQEAVNLVFAPGFSTADAISDLSGRGVGMDVVRNALDKVGGSVALSSELGKGTTVTLSLPLSMAVTNVMIIESDGRLFGVPMETVAETVRVPRSEIQRIKHKKTAVLRGRIVPLISLNDLLAIPAEPRTNDDDEIATLVLRLGAEHVGMLVDDFREVVDIILKPMPGDLAKLSCYAGTALLGDGSVLVVLNPKELFR